MRHQLKRLLKALLLSALAASAVSAQTAMCFESKGLKALNRISFKLEGNKIAEGNFEISGYDDSVSAETFIFSGTKTGNILRIIFAGTIPYERPPKTKSIVWTLGKNILRVPAYGKNYDTNKFSAYISDYEKCAGK